MLAGVMTRVALIRTNVLLAAVCAILAAGCKTRLPPSAHLLPPAAPQPPDESAPADPFVIHAPDGSCEITINTAKAPDMKDWAEHKLAPVLADWYPKISAMLPTAGYTPPRKWSVTIAPGNGVAATGGTHVTANATWFRGELDKQAVGALVHEEVHVVQQYGGARRNFTLGNFSYGD